MKIPKPVYVILAVLFILVSLVSMIELYDALSGLLVELGIITDKDMYDFSDLLELFE